MQTYLSDLMPRRRVTAKKKKFNLSEEKMHGFQRFFRKEVLDAFFYKGKLTFFYSVKLVIFLCTS